MAVTASETTVISLPDDRILAAYEAELASAPGLGSIEGAPTLTPPEATEEIYGNSVSAHRRWGGVRRMLGRAAVIPETRAKEEAAAREMSYRDFMTAIAEMLKTDSEFRDYLDVEVAQSYSVIDNAVIAPDGSPMRTILATGLTSAKEAAISQPELYSEVERSTYDLEICDRANALKPGMILWGISMEPKKELQQHPETFKHLGYREGLIYLQAYTKVDEHTMVTHSFSVDKSDEKLWRQVLSSYGMTVPEGVSNNAWLHYAVEQKGSPEDAQKLLAIIRADFYKQLGSAGNRHSINEYVAMHAQTADAFFDAYYPALADAAFSQRNNATLQTLASKMLNADIAKLKPEIREQLITISTAKSFDKASARVIDSIIRYATVEQLRKGLSGLVYAPGPSEDGAVTAQDHVVLYHHDSNEKIDIDQLLVNNVRSGIEAGRGYGGCPGNIELGTDADNALPGGGSSRQEAFAGVCVEVKDGQITTCPSCKQRVKAIVPDRETIYCSNERCDLASPDLKRSLPKAATVGSRIISLWSKLKLPEKKAKPLPEASKSQAGSQTKTTQELVA